MRGAWWYNLQERESRAGAQATGRRRETVSFDQFLQEVCPPLDLEWRRYRRRSARHRVEARMRELGLADYASYLELAHANPAEAEGLSDLMRVTVSRFFRERGCWSDLAGKVLPALLSAKAPDLALRAWSAGCCGGEEPYTLALLWLEYLRPLHPDRSLEILATDIDEVSLERAREALYADGSLREVPAEIRSRWFCRTNGLWRLDERVKRLVRFEKGNLMTDPLPPAMDLVMCRYLPFTYYRGERRSMAAKRLWEALRPGGVLMIGGKEHLGSSAGALFEPWPGTGVFFRRGAGP